MGNFAYNIRRMLLMHGKTVPELATHCRVSRQTVYRWMSGTEPRDSAKQCVARFFGVSLLDMEVYIPNEKRKETCRRIMDALEFLSDKQLQVILEVAEDFNELQSRRAECDSV